MAKLDFPSSPTDGQVYAAPNGVDYTWSSTVNAWTARVTDPLTLVSNGSISGTAEVGKVLVYTIGEASGGIPPYTYSWEWRLTSDDSVLQVGGLTLTVPASAVGDTIYIFLTATDSAANTVDGRTEVFPVGGSVITYSSFPNLSFSPNPSPNASPSTINVPAQNLYGTVSGTWNDGFTNIYATGGILFSVNGGGYTSSSTSISNGDTLSLAWDTAVISAAADGDTVVGILTNGTYENGFAITIDRAPTGLVFADLTDQELSTQVTSDTVTPTGFNVPVPVSFAGSATPLTSLGLSVGGGSFGSSPQTVNPGQSLQLRGTTGGSNSTAYGVNIAMGSNPTATDTWTVTTAAVTATIAEPSITAPANGATDVGGSDGVTLIGSTYTPLNGAGSQTSSQWEVYEAIPVEPTTNTISSISIAAGNAQTGPWTLADVAQFVPTNNLYSVIFDGTQFVALGDAQDIVTSPDGLTWTQVATTGLFNSYTLSYSPSGGVYIAGGNNRSIYISSDLSTWTSITSNFPWPGNPADSLQYITYADNQFVAVVFGNGAGLPAIVTSTDNGLNWSNFGTFGFQNGGSTGNGSTVAQSAVYSSDLNKWFVGGSWGQIRYTTTGSSFSGSSGANTSVIGNLSNAPDVRCLAAGGGVVVAGTGDGRILTSTDASNWSVATTLGGGTKRLSSIAYGNGLWVVVGDGGLLATSTDTVNWTTITSGFVTSIIYSVAFGNNTFTAVGQGANAAVGFADASKLSLANNDGLLNMSVGDTVIEVGGGSNASGVITAIDASVGTPSLTVSPSSSNWTVGATVKDTSAPLAPSGPPSTDPPNPSNYSAVTGSPFTVSSAPFTSLDIAKPPMTADTTYYARVQYATTNATAATSDWSPWSEFTTGSLVITINGWTQAYSFLNNFPSYWNSDQSGTLVFPFTQTGGASSTNVTYVETADGASFTAPGTPNVGFSTAGGWIATTNGKMMLSCVNINSPYASTFLLSSNAGSTWSPVTSPGNNARILSGGNNVWFAQTPSSPLSFYRSTDDGTSWSTSTTYRAFAGPQYVGSNTFVMYNISEGVNASTPTILRSTDDGASWSQITTSLDWKRGSPRPDAAGYNGSTILMGGERVAGTQYPAVARSTDGGLNWTVHNVFTTSAAAADAVAYGGGLWITVVNGVVYSSADDGQTWTATPAVVNGGVQTLLYSPTYNSFYVVSTNNTSSWIYVNT